MRAFGLSWPFGRVATITSRWNSEPSREIAESRQDALNRQHAARRKGTGPAQESLPTHAQRAEPAGTHVWEDLSARNFESGASPDFGKAKIADAMKRHAFVDTTRAEHLAALPVSLTKAPPVSLESFRFGQVLRMCKDVVENGCSGYSPAQNRMGKLRGIFRFGVIHQELAKRGAVVRALESACLTTVGGRLRHARANADFTRQEAAGMIGIARTTLVAIEKGQRRVRINELRRLAKLYRVSVNALLRREAMHIDLAPRFRKLPKSAAQAADEAVRIMSHLANAEAELENLLGINRSKNYPPERPIMRGDCRAQAENDALELRQRLGLGNAPITDIAMLLEIEMGVRVFVKRVNSRISGLLAYDGSLGPCILLNANHRRDRRAQSAAHLCGRLVSTRSEPEILYEHGTASSREERYADAFGKAFLTPPRAVTQKFQELAAGSDMLTRRHVIVLAHFFGVSREAMVRRLEELQLAKAGTRDWFQTDGEIANRHVKQVSVDRILADDQNAEAGRPMSLPLGMLAAEAHRQNLLTEAQLSTLLGLGRIELRKLLDDLEIEGSEADAVPALLG